ncbi:MAG: galactosyltransferase-related protein [Phormidesmis sp.]
MDIVTLDVVIAVKDRASIYRCVSTLLAQINLVDMLSLGHILLCDGGSLTATCQHQLAQVAKLSKVKILRCCHQGFNKSWLLNQGLAAATARLVLVSDVDILWSAATLKKLSLAAMRQPNCVYSVRSVKESDPSAKAAQRQRYSYHITRNNEAARVEIYLAAVSSVERPGCGLLCAQKTLFQKIGGYRDCFQGWGWEDQDFLIRAQLLGYSVEALGSVVHITHGDSRRNALHQQRSPQQSRDRNILRCLNGLAKGQLLGDLPQKNPVARQFPTVSVQYPANLCDLP